MKENTSTVLRALQRTLILECLQDNIRGEGGKFQICGGFPKLKYPPAMGLGQSGREALQSPIGSRRMNFAN